MSVCRMEILIAQFAVGCRLEIQLEVGSKPV
jgi:hypothetical protein